MHLEPEIFLIFLLTESLRNKFNNTLMAYICCGLSKFQVSISDNEVSCYYLIVIIFLSLPGA